jgi:trehalose 6-phosphate phosphatase
MTPVPVAMNPHPPARDQPHWRNVLPDLERRLVADRILVASDFDGTLSPIAATPEAAVILPEARAALSRLSRLPGVTVAVISGRALANVEEKVGLPDMVYAGNHGLEMQGPNMPPLTFFTADVREELEAAIAALRSSLDGIEGVLIEDKGSSASVHYRQVDPVHFDTIAAAVSDAAASSPQIQLRHGKMVWELRPGLGWNKGSAVIRLMARFKIRAAATFFMGDDETDNDVFHVLPMGATFIVGERSAREASFRCFSPQDVAELLSWMANCREKLTAAIG